MLVQMAAVTLLAVVSLLYFKQIQVFGSGV